MHKNKGALMTKQTIFKCYMCGSDFTIGGDDKDGTHYYMPIQNSSIAAKYDDKKYRNAVESISSLVNDFGNECDESAWGLLKNILGEKA